MSPLASSAPSTRDRSVVRPTVVGRVVAALVIAAGLCELGGAALIAVLEATDDGTGDWDGFGYVLAIWVGVPALFALLFGALGWRVPGGLGLLLALVGGAFVVAPLLPAIG